MIFLMTALPVTILGCLLAASLQKSPTQWLPEIIAPAGILACMLLTGLMLENQYF